MEIEGRAGKSDEIKPDEYRERTGTGGAGRRHDPRVCDFWKKKLKL
jgi:hypothetical protein